MTDATPPSPPSPEELRTAARGFDARNKKILIAIVARMIEHSDRVRDREWLSEQLAGTIAVALEVGEDETLDSTSEGVAKVQAYAQEHGSELLNTALGIFIQVALALQRRGGPITGEAAMLEVMSYVEEPPAAE